MGCIALLLLCTTCDNKLDIVPKGKTTLENVTDLELLLNQEWELSTHPVSDLGIIATSRWDKCCLFQMNCRKATL